MTQQNLSAPESAQINPAEPLYGAASLAVRDQLRKPSASYDPLHKPDDTEVFPASVDGELRLARKYLDQVATANIHDHTAMVAAASGLDYRFRALIAAIEAERGEGQ